MENVFVSVIMPTYNTNESYLRDAIESILNQSYKNFEFIIIDDGSAKHDYDIAKSFKDERIKLYRNANNSGLPYTLNRAIDISKGKYIFRMDSDDISLPHRIETMIRYMEENPFIDIAGSGKINFGANKKKHYMPLNDDEIRSTLLFKSAFVHPTVVFKKAAIKEFGIEYSSEEKAEDYNLWVKCSKHQSLVFGNCNELLLNYRIHDAQITNKDNKINKSTESIIKKNLENHDIELNNFEKDLYIKFALGNSILKYNELLKIDSIIEKNIFKLGAGKINKDILIDVLGEKFARECIRQVITYKNYNGAAFLKSNIRKKANISLKYRILLWITKGFSLIKL